MNSFYLLIELLIQCLIILCMFSKNFWLLVLSFLFDLVSLWSFRSTFMSKCGWFYHMSWIVSRTPFYILLTPIFQSPFLVCKIMLKIASVIIFITLLWKLFTIYDVLSAKRLAKIRCFCMFNCLRISIVLICLNESFCRCVEVFMLY